MLATHVLLNVILVWLQLRSTLQRTLLLERVGQILLMMVPLLLRLGLSLHPLNKGRQYVTAYTTIG